MDTLTKAIIEQAPNLIIAVLALLWLSQKMDRVLDVLLTLLMHRIDEAHLAPQDSIEPTALNEVEHARR